MIAAINPHSRPVLGEEDFNIFLSLHAYKTLAIESNDCRRRLNAKKQRASKEPANSGQKARVREFKPHTSERACTFAKVSRVLEFETSGRFDIARGLRASEAA